jgi:hypothetical protein
MSPEFTRRAMLALMASIPKASLPKPARANHWVNFKFTGFKPAFVGKNRYIGQWIGLRNDGVHFYTTATAWTRDEMDDAKKTARIYFDTFVFPACDCNLERQCKFHHNPELEKALADWDKDELHMAERAPQDSD